jgi:hypothetical protein
MSSGGNLSKRVTQLEGVRANEDKPRKWLPEWLLDLWRAESGEALDTREAVLESLRRGNAGAGDIPRNREGKKNFNE